MSEYYGQTHFVDHQINSYNYFITEGMQEIVRRECPLTINNLTMNFTDVRLEKPVIVKKIIKRLESMDRKDLDCVEITEDAVPVKGGEKTIINYVTTPMFPQDARKRNMSYEGTISATLIVENMETKKTTIHKNISLGKLPVMLHSKACRLTEENKVEQGECANDFGGYFINKGKERVLIGQMRRAYNKVYVGKSPDDKYEYLAEMRSMNEQGGSILVQLKINTDNHELFFSLPYIKTKSFIPAGLVFKALGATKEEMYSYTRVSKPEILETLSYQYDSEATPDEVFEYIANNISDETKDAEYVKTILRKELFYHVGELTFTKSAKHLGYMIKKIVDTAYNGRMLDDKDNLANKRLDGTSELISFMFQMLFKQFIKTLCNNIENKKNPDPVSLIKDNKVITHVMNQVFMTGNWNTQKSSQFTRVGVSQVLSMQNYGAKLSHLRRIMLPIGKMGKNPGARQLHASHFSFICPYETPEGDTVGIVSNLALSVVISQPTDPNIVLEKMKEMTTFREDDQGKSIVLLNGCIVGTCDVSIRFYKEFDALRKSEIVDKSVSIVRLVEENEIHIQTDGGRFLRPLFALGPGNKVLYKNGVNKTWNEHVKDNSIVFREVWELEQSVVAMTETDLTKYRCDYLEISPSSTMMGIMASAIPLSNHSQSPRNAYQSSMGKQAIGIPSMAYANRYDTSLHVLNTPQQPITKNELINVLRFNEMSHGANPIVAIMTFSGFNQEDSIILNKGSLDRGLFMTTTYKTITEEEKKNDSICSPKFQYRNRNYDYGNLNENGLVWKKNVFLRKGTVLIGKVTKKMIKNDEGIRIAEITDSSIVVKHGEEGYLDAVLDTLNEGVRVIKIRIRVLRRPEIGDKFASSTAQKGTCGMIFPEEDMPFDKDGVKPDLIINPHAIPTRMTINMLIEMGFNIVGCKLGKMMDATPFKHPDIESELKEYSDQIKMKAFEKERFANEDLETFAKRLGLDSFASQLMDGRTGERFPTKIFMGPCFYQQLKHRVSDKIYSRLVGPVDPTTHQPVAGRSREGGLKCGEMERDGMISHGSTKILNECLFERSDKYVIPVCRSCGMVPNKRDYCTTCEESNIEMKNMPYATKLFYQELLGMGLNLLIR